MLAELETLVGEAVVAVLVLSGGVVVAWRLGLLSAVGKTFGAYKELAEAYEERISELERKVEELRGLYEEKVKHIEYLNGVLDGKDRAAADMVTAIAMADVCRRAPFCMRRILPGSVVEEVVIDGRDDA
ncbi:MAG: hypothetical protein RQ731_07935 [Anaerosomatales bacterium]|nr:hypothetical protein [Anaerosomatales bacterium]